MPRNHEHPSAEPHATPETPESGHAGHAATHVAENRANTNDRVHAATGDTLHPAAPVSGNHEHDYKRPSFLEYKSLPKTPTIRHLGAAALTTAAVINPVTTGVVAGGVGVSMWGWNKLAKVPPFRWIDKGARGALGAAAKGVNAAWNVGTYPLRTGATIGANTVRAMVGRPAHYMFERSKDLLSDLRVVLKQKHGVKDEHGEYISLPALGVLTAKNAIAKTIALPFKFANWYFHALSHKPIRTILGTVGAVGVIGATGGPVAFSTEFANTVLKILKGIASMFGGA